MNERFNNVLEFIEVYGWCILALELLIGAMITPENNIRNIFLISSIISFIVFVFIIAPGIINED